MTNFKSGSGNLDFGDDNEETADDTNPTEPDESATETQAVTEPPESDTLQTDSSEEHTVNESSTPTSDSSRNSDEAYPYFVRRNNVGDERDTRLEIHVRDKVAEREANFRAALAEELATSDVSKTDAREFALIAAFENPERVAELMTEEGFGTFN
jgi:hypothetical protein